MIHQLRPSRREFLATGAVAAAGCFLGQGHEAQAVTAEADRYALSGLPTGFCHLDRLTEGLQRRELVLLASRPSVGKTSLALNISDFVAVATSTPALYVSLGTSQLEIAQRLLCARGEICHTELRHRTLSTDVGLRLTQAAAEISHAPLYIDDQPLRTAADISAVADRLGERLSPESRLGLVVVDYLQRIEAEYPIRSVRDHFTDVACELRQLAHDMNVAVLCLMQLNGCPSMPRDCGITPGELRGAQDAADTIMFLDRPGTDRPPSEDWNSDSKREALLSVVMRKDRLAGTVELSWSSQYGRFARAGCLPYMCMNHPGWPPRVSTPVEEHVDPLQGIQFHRTIILDHCVYPSNSQRCLTNVA